MNKFARSQNVSQWKLDIVEMQYINSKLYKLFNKLLSELPQMIVAAHIVPTVIHVACPF